MLLEIHGFIPDKSCPSSTIHHHRVFSGIGVAPGTLSLFPNPECQDILDLFDNEPADHRTAVYAAVGIRLSIMTHELLIFFFFLLLL